MKAKYIAVDIALIPERQIIDQAIEAARKYCDYDRLPLEFSSTIPHISLMMLIVKIERLELLIQELGDLITNDLVLTLDLKIEKSSYSINSNGMLLSSWNVEKDETLISVHSDIFQLYASYHQEEIENSKVSNSEILAYSGMKYVREFRTKHSLENYEPHITLGYGLVESQPKAIFNASKIGIYQMGEHCSCKKPLWETNN